MTLTFDQAIELFEITDISKIQAGDILQLEKKTKKRWHPDRVAHLKNPEITQEYTVKFQQIETAAQMITSFLLGTYRAGEAFTPESKTVYEEPEDIIRKNASEIQSTLKNLWNLIKEKKYKWSDKQVLLSDGFVLKDLLREDFREDIAMLSVVSFFYGLLILGILTAIGSLISPVIGTLIAIIWIFQALSCLLGFAPLSRFWIKSEMVQDIMFRFINFGLAVYNWSEEQGQESTKIWVLFLIRTPVLFAKLIKYLILFPLYEIAKLVVGDRVVGVVKQNVNYYADAAEWYIDDLITKSPDEMSNEELFHLSHIYSELSDIESKI